MGPLCTGNTGGEGTARMSLCDVLLCGESCWHRHAAVHQRLQPGQDVPLVESEVRKEGHPAKKRTEDHGLGAQAGNGALSPGPGSLSSWLLGSMSPQARPCSPRAHGGRDLGFILLVCGSKSSSLEPQFLHV